MTMMRKQDAPSSASEEELWIESFAIALIFRCISGLNCELEDTPIGHPSPKYISEYYSDNPTLHFSYFFSSHTYFDVLFFPYLLQTNSPVRIQQARLKQSHAQ